MRRAVPRSARLNSPVQQLHALVGRQFTPEIAMGHEFNLRIKTGHINVVWPRSSAFRRRLAQSTPPDRLKAGLHTGKVSDAPYPQKFLPTGAGVFTLAGG